MNVEFISGADVMRRLTYSSAVDALERALEAGLDPETDATRTFIPLEDGHDLLVMPSAAAGPATVKLLTVGASSKIQPRIQGVCVVFDRTTLAPTAVIDGAALTLLRTAAVSALAVRRLATEDASRVLIFGRGPQSSAHEDAFRQVRKVKQVDIVGREGAPNKLLAAADIVCCATTAHEPLFDGTLLADHATVVAIGSHDPTGRETDDAVVRRSTVIVESRTSAFREAGDIIAAGLRPEDVSTIGEVVRGEVSLDTSRPRFFKSTGMGWEDAVVAAAIAAT